MEKKLKKQYDITMMECIAKLEELSIFCSTLRAVSEDRVEKILGEITSLIEHGKGILSGQGVYKNPYEQLTFGFDLRAYRYLKDNWVYYFNDILLQDKLVILNQLFKELENILHVFFDLSLKR